MAADFIQGTNLLPSRAKQTFGTSAKVQSVSAEIQKLNVIIKQTNSHMPSTYLLGWIDGEQSIPLSFQQTLIASAFAFAWSIAEYPKEV
jgi:hypothetical protein